MKHNMLETCTRKQKILWLIDVVYVCLFTCTVSMNMNLLNNHLYVCMYAYRRFCYYSNVILYLVYMLELVTLLYVLKAAHILS